MRWLRGAAVVLGGLLVIGCCILFGLHFSWSGPCGPGSMPCPSTPFLCIPQRSWCNGHADCPNGDDETNLGCADLSGSSMVLNAVLSSRKPPLPHRPCRLVSYPDGCACKGTVASCRGRNLSRVPVGISKDVTRLLLLNNSIESLDASSFTDYPSLTHIHLASNEIVHIAPGTFSRKGNLEKLLLMNNKLERWDVGNDELADLESLEWLFLDDNLLEDDSWPLYKLGSLRSLVWLSLARNRLTLENQVFPPMASLQELDISSNYIKCIEETVFWGLKNITMLILKQNAIHTIHPSAFSFLSGLEELNLAHNCLTTLPPHIFDSLVHLTKLDLSNNPVHIPSHLFVHLSSLTSLALRGIDIDDIDLNMFSVLPQLNNIYFKSYYYCSFVPNVPRCKPNNDGVSSLENLLHALPLRLTVWLVSLFTLFANILVLSGRRATSDDNKMLSLVIRSLAAADLLMGVYLLLIATADAVLRGEYNRRAHSWMTSWPCTLAGALSMLSSEVSVLTLVFMSLDRFLIIADPLGAYQLSFGSSARSIAAIWISGGVLSLLPVVVHWRTSTRFYGTNGMCFPLHIDDPFLVGWQYSAFVFLGVNGTSLVLVALLYLGMFLSIVRTRRATPLALGEVDVAVRFFFIVVTDACCWAPIAVMKALALGGIHISAELYAWVVVFLVPINSAVNPLLYTLTIPKYRTVLARMVGRVTVRCCSCEEGAGSRRQSADTDCSRASNNNRVQLTSAPTSVVSRTASRTRVDAEPFDGKQPHFGLVGALLAPPPSVFGGSVTSSSFDEP